MHPQINSLCSYKLSYLLTKKRITMHTIKQRLLFQYYRYLGRCAGHYLKKHNIFSIGINGSVGKTSARMIIYQTLKKTLPDSKIITSPKNFNGELWLSLSILEIKRRTPSVFTFFKVGCKAFIKALRWKKNYECIILEYGIDRPKEMDFLLNIHKPHIGVFTAIDAVHSEQFGDPSQIAAEEIKMLQNTREIAFLNTDDPYARQLLPELKIDTFTYQTNRSQNHYDISFNDEKINQNTDWTLTVSIPIQIKSTKLNITTNLLSKPNYGYLGVALTIANIYHTKIKGFELDFKTLLSTQLNFELQAWRCTLFQGKYESILIDSTYNASPLSMRKLIDTTLQINKSLPQKRKIMLVLWDMRELGDLTEQEHRLLAGYVQQSADYLVLLGDSMQKFLKDELTKIGFPLENLHMSTTAPDAGKRICDFLKQQKDKRIILFKGSQNTIFLEEALKKVLKNPEDSQQLTRQSSRRTNKKQRNTTLVNSTRTA